MFLQDNLCHSRPPQKKNFGEAAAVKQAFCKMDKQCQEPISGLLTVQN